MSLHDVIEDVKTEVARETGIIQSAIALIRGLATAAKNALDGGDEDELRAILQSAHDGADELAAAVTENTPAEEPAAQTQGDAPADPQGDEPAVDPVG